MELDSDSRADPYRTWLSSLVFMRLIYEHHEAQSIAMGLTVGDAETGEEVITAIQTLSANLAASLQYNLDPRISLAFLMVLCVWLFDNSEAVNDFLNEGSTVEAILAILNQTDKTNVMIQGMCAFLMGIVFEFSTKDSPIPRSVSDNECSMKFEYLQSWQPQWHTSCPDFGSPKQRSLFPQTPQTATTSRR